MSSGMMQSGGKVYLRLALAVLGLLCCAALAGCPQRNNTVPATGAQIAVYFSPNGGCTTAIVEQIAAAKNTIDVQAYSFTSKPIAEALVAAAQRGVKVRAVLDKSQRTERYTSATHLSNENVPVWIDDRHAIAHNKIMIIDSSTLITGSFNFTNAAEKENAENLLIIQGRPDLIAMYQKNFDVHLEHSTPYSREAASERSPSRAIATPKRTSRSPGR